MGNKFFKILGVDKYNKQQLCDFANTLGIDSHILKYYNDNHLLPPMTQLKKIAAHTGIHVPEMMVKMGIYNYRLKKLLSENWEFGLKALDFPPVMESINHQFVFDTKLGKLYQGDCVSLLNTMIDDSIDLVFADPPFNLNKSYRSGMDDEISSEKYIAWCEDWLDECIRVLKPGGGLFIWNLPKWNTYFSNFLNERLTFKNWIATDIKYTLPIASRLYPSHYSLLYYVKGEKANTFKPDRLQMETCRHCYKEIRDYGGYKSKMNPAGINMSDVWFDIPPVRHAKHKKRKEANELSVKLLDRIIEMASKEGDIIFDPFGGAGTTYLVAELKKRKWIGVELGPTDTIVDRLSSTTNESETINKYRDTYNALFPKKIKQARIKRGLWTDETFTTQNV